MTGDDLARTRPRGCLVDGCQQETLAMVICPPHFNLLPARLSGAVWREYQRAYEQAGNDVFTAPPGPYKDALRKAVEWLEENTVST